MPGAGRRFSRAKCATIAPSLRAAIVVVSIVLANAPGCRSVAPPQATTTSLAADRPPADAEQASPPPSSTVAQPVETIEVAGPDNLNLEELEALAIENNPSLRRMRQEASAAWARAEYVDKLPDPAISSMFFGDAMHFVPDRQLAQLELMQMIPWLDRLAAEASQARFEALALENMYQAERARIVGQLRAAWFQLFVLHRQIETSIADQAQLESLITTINARVATGNAQPGDVLMSTLELSSLQERLVTLRRELVSTTAELNRLTGRDARSPIEPPPEIPIELPAWNHELLFSIAREAQPELIAARLTVAATRAGLDVARLRRRPDLGFGAGWMIMTADPADTMPHAGADAWTLNGSATVPLWHGKYRAIEAEAVRRHYAAHASADEIEQRLDAELMSLWAAAQASHDVVRLYETTILPQARQTLDADLQSLANNTVTLDRVIRDYRAVLGFQLEYIRAQGELATTIARIRQTVGVDVLAGPAIR